MKSIAFITSLMLFLALSGSSLLAQSQSDKISFTKTFKAETISTEKKFSSNAKLTNMLIKIVGETTSGSIEIQLIKPDGKIFKSLEIDSSSDVIWRNKLSKISGDESYTGDWVLKVQAKNASGSYIVEIEQY